MEYVKPNIDYTLSVNLKLQVGKPITYAIHAYKIWLATHIKRYVKTFSFYWELSPNGKLHIHGWISFSDDKSIVQWYHNLYSTSASMELDTIDDLKDWVLYCTKQNRFHRVLNEHYDIKTPYTYSRTM